MITEDVKIHNLAAAKVLQHSTAYSFSYIGWLQLAADMEAAANEF